ncbi:MAG: bifunctional diguanylate cyclase/phosphodiesterase [Burkholderiales bacterium]|nr:bifunctional diguanylate cyclase/phosphodiesterase [Burkholderiales bacterium]
MSPHAPLSHPPSAVAATKRLAQWREDLLRTVLAVAVPAGSLLVVIGTWVAWFKQDMAMAATNIVGLATLLGLRYLPGLTVRVRGVGMLAIVTGVGLSFLFNRIGAFSLPWLSAAPIMAALLLGRTAALLITALICAVAFPLGYVYGLPLAPLPLLPHPALMWLLLGLNFLTLSLIIALSAAVLLRRLDQAVDQASTAQQLMTQLALVDPLTGLPNRRALRDELQAQSLHPLGQSALMFIDMDNFKDVNDSYGHLKGDELLVRVARRLSTQVPKPSFVARMGGDEFVVLFHADAAHPAPLAAQALAKAEQLRQAMAQPFSLPDNQRVSTTISIGLSLLPNGLVSADDAMREADTALYQAKGKGRNQVTLFEQTMHTALQQRMQLANDLSHALRNRGLSVAVQTQVNAAQQVIGAELLARWTHPTLGHVPPSQFIPLAEHSGLIVPLGDWMLTQACLLAVRLQAAGHTVPLSVNISALQFRQPDFEQRLQATLAEHGVAPAALMLEITESLTMTDEGDTIASMTRLVAQGFRFSMDDFGTGYSSLSYLKRLPLHELKIDRSFVDDLPDDPHDVAIVRMILSMAGTLGLTVVAEGVETRAQADFLLAHGCHSLQGYLFSRPAPVDAWLAGLDS